MVPSRHRLQCRFIVDTEEGLFLNDTRIRLLECIDLQGSITWAAKSAGISYKAAWDFVDSINRQARDRVVERVVGGHKGGHSRLTTYGKRLVAFYRAVEWESQVAIEALSGHLDPASDDCNFRYLLKQRAIKRIPHERVPGMSEVQP